MTRKRLFHTSRLFRHINKMPTPEDTGFRQFPVVETWSAFYQRRGLAHVDIHVDQYGVFTCFNILEDCGQITHWRWKV